MTMEYSGKRTAPVASCLNPYSNGIMIEHNEAKKQNWDEGS